MKLISSFFALSLCLTFACRTTESNKLAVGSSGKTGGTDAAARARKAAWFLGEDRQVKVCIAMEGVQLTSLQAQDAIKAPLTFWTAFIQKNVDDHATPSKYKFASDFTFTDTCSDADVKVQFGSSGGRPSEADATDVGLSLKGATTSQKNLIWIAGPEALDWSDLTAPQIVLYQQMAGIFGGEPTAGTPLGSLYVERLLEKSKDTPREQRLKLLEDYVETLKKMQVLRLRDPLTSDDPFGDPRVPCNTGRDPATEIFVRSFPAATCYYLVRNEDK